MRLYDLILSTGVYSMKHAQLLMVPALALALAMTGCASKKPATTATTTTSATDTAANGANTNGVGSNGAMDGQNMNGNGPMDAMKAALMSRVVHFGYDSSDLSQEDFGTLNAHSRYLASTAGAKVTLVGHTDERGTREYNLALGERRAKAVQAFLVTNGANNSQIETVSYGKETPVNEGHSEAAWAENRRVEIKYEAMAPAQ
jgi:peptidoglycan-associated lipoprotein